MLPTMDGGGSTPDSALAELLTAPLRNSGKGGPSSRPSPRTTSGSGGGSKKGGGGGGSKKGGGKKTSYVQTIKGNKAEANTHRRQVRLLRRLARARREGMSNLRGQYDNALKRNADIRRLEVADLLGGFRTAQEGYDRSNTDAESNLGSTVSGSQLNRAREGMNAMSELSNMQAGETDRIKGMAASLRNMQVNMQGGASDYSNAITSINNSLGELNSTIRTNINNSLRGEDANNAQAFGEWTAGLQQGQSDLVDLYGQMGAEYEQVADSLATKTSKQNSTGTDHIKSTQTNTTTYKGTGGKKALGGAKDAFSKAAAAADKLADLQGRKYTGTALSIDQMNALEADPNMRFEEAAMKANQSNLDDLANGGTLRKLAAPEGSKLRKVAV